MFNTGRLEELRNNALIVMKGLKKSIINASTYAEPTIAQAIAVFTVCDTIVSNVDEYLTHSEDYGDKNLDLFLIGMNYLLRSVRTDEIGYYVVVLECCADNAVLAHFMDMVEILRARLYYE